VNAFCDKIEVCRKGVISVLDKSVWIGVAESKWQHTERVFFHEAFRELAGDAPVMGEFGAVLDGGGVNAPDGCETWCDKSVSGFGLRRRAMLDEVLPMLSDR
jgi:hypothetical protein